uniref:Disease resistance N-terminal domain-containing protein n=1 Tax=Triticum urartu TaxID=4572 RepID=A0A8R7PUA8_TRIUA
MAESAVAAVLSKFGELAASEAKILLEVGDNMMLLRDRLEWLQAFIRDADRKRRTGTDGLTRVWVRWVRQTRDVAFEAEDALDEFFYEVELKRHGYHGWKMWRKYLTGFWNQVIIRHVFSARIKRINRRLKKISENQKEYKIEHTPLATLTSSTTATSAWYAT